MDKIKLYTYLAGVSGLIGVGMLLGHNLAQGTSSTPLWVGGILIFLSAVLIGMTISAKSGSADRPKLDE